MTLAIEPIAYARRLLNDTNPNGRWSDGTMLDFLDRASKRLMRDVLFPAARISTQTVANQQLYQLPVVLQILSVYVNGQLASPTDQATLEGHQIDLYDQGFYGALGTQTSGSAGPTGTTGTFTPKWNIRPPAEYPVQNSWGWPRPDAQPSGTTQPPRFFFRGGYIALVPAPANAAPVVNGVAVDNLVMDCVMLPDTIVSLNQRLWYDEQFVPALAWAIVADAKFGDDTQKTAESRNYAAGEYRRCVGDLRMWKATYTGDAPGGAKVQTSRAYYRGYQRARTRAGGYP